MFQFSRPQKLTDKASGFGTYSIYDVLAMVALFIVGESYLPKMVYPKLSLLIQLIFPILMLFWFSPSGHYPSKKKFQVLFYLMKRRTIIYLHGDLE